MRAAIYHLGVLKYLAESGLYGNISAVSSVSGASLCIGAMFAVNKNKWVSGEEFLRDTLPNVREMMLGCDIQKSALNRLPFLPKYWFNRVEILAEMLEKKWGIRGTIQDLPLPPDSPYWEINCTTFETGQNWRVRKDYMGDFTVGYTQNPNLPISEMIAASAGFPVLIGPYTLKTSGMSWTGDKHGAGESVRVEPRYTLWDGGVYDNLGMEALYKIGKGLDDEIDFLIVSDASGGMGFHKYKKNASLYNVKRLLDISMNQVYALRSREFRASAVESGVGAYLQISGAARSYSTTLRTPCRQEFDMILLNGYRNAGLGVCD